MDLSPVFLLGYTRIAFVPSMPYCALLQGSNPRIEYFAEFFSGDNCIFVEPEVQFSPNITSRISFKEIWS